VAEERGRVRDPRGRHRPRFALKKKFYFAGIRRDVQSLPPSKISLLGSVLVARPPRERNDSGEKIALPRKVGLAWGKSRAAGFLKNTLKLLDHPPPPLAVHDPRYFAMFI